MKLTVKGLTRVFGTVRAVDALDFDLGEGEIWGFIGPNGAGKTTTLRMLATIDRPTRGDAWLNGHSITKEADVVRPLIGFVPDFFGAYSDMLVIEYLDFFARAYGLRGAHRRRRTAEIVDFVEMGPLLEKRVTDLSKGMQQRISLGRALLHDPELLLLDEPAAGLDPRARRHLRELLRLLAAESGKTILISSHILTELEDLVGKVLIIDEGKLVFSGAPEDHRHDGVSELTLHVQVLGDPQVCARLLLETPAVVSVQTVEPDLLHVRLAGGKAEIAGLIEKLVASNQRPYQVVTEGKVLERMFFDVADRGPNG